MKTSRILAFLAACLITLVLFRTIAYGLEVQQPPPCASGGAR
jgi:hypothetical protein